MKRSWLCNKTCVENQKDLNSKPSRYNQEYNAKKTGIKNSYNIQIEKLLSEYLSQNTII